MGSDRIGNCESCGREQTKVCNYKKVLLAGNEWRDMDLCVVCRNMTGDRNEWPERAQDIWILFDLLKGRLTETLDEPAPAEGGSDGD